MWQGLQSITDYKKKTSPVSDQDVLLPDRLNNFFARYEDKTVPLTWLVTKTCRLSFTAANVSKTFKRLNPRKAACPDNIPSHVLRACAGQLAGVFTDIFNQSPSLLFPHASRGPPLFLFPRKEQKGNWAKRLSPRSTHFCHHEVH